MAAEFFLYHEDVDLSLRLRLLGGRLGVESEARVDHSYEFAKGSQKWHWLERNRWATLIRTYPALLLVLLAPALLATELALVAVAARGGWLDEKARRLEDDRCSGFPACCASVARSSARAPSALPPSPARSAPSSTRPTSAPPDGRRC